MANKWIRVTVFERDFASLNVAGLPLSLNLQLQTSGLKLPDALCTAKSSTGSFSVSFFWPSVYLQPLNDKEKKQNRRKRKRKTKPKKNNAQCGNCDTNIASDNTPNSANTTSVDAHHSP